jgi:hypothetical protein
MNKSEYERKSFQSETDASILQVKVIGQNGLTVMDSNSQIGGGSYMGARDFKDFNS